MKNLTPIYTLEYYIINNVKLKKINEVFQKLPGDKIYSLMSGTSIEYKDDKVIFARIWR